MIPSIARLPRALAFFCLLLGLFGGGVTVRAANDLVLRLNTTTSSSSVVAGESTVTGHTGEIDILAFSWGVSRAGAGSTAAPQNLTLTKRLDKSSTALMLAVFQATNFPTGVLYVRNQGANPLDFFKITMNSIVVTQYTTSTTSDGAIIETISLSFGRISFDYQPQNPDGTAVGPVISGGWNITTNQAL